DGQSVETSERGDPHGYDGAQELPGRKRHALVDTLGLALGVVAHPIDLQDRPGALWPLRRLQPTRPRLELIWADSAYPGPLQTWVWEPGGWRVQVVERSGGRGGWMRVDQGPPGCRPSAPLPRPGSWHGPSRGLGATAGCAKMMHR